MDIQPYIDKLMAAKNGAEMRNPIASVLKELYKDGKDADYLVGTDGVKKVGSTYGITFAEDVLIKQGNHVWAIDGNGKKRLYLCVVKEHLGAWDPSHFEELKILVRKDDFKKYTPLDMVPTANSEKLVSSTGIYAMIGDLSALEVL